MITIYTDGSTREKNQRGVNNKGGFGYIAYDETGAIIDAYSKQVENTTNNEMELNALVLAILNFGIEDEWDCPTIYCDSMYAINCLTVWGPTWQKNGWVRAGGKSIENLEIIKTGIAALQSGKYNVNIEYCKGHNGIEGNELADKLATGTIMPEEVLNKYGN